MHENLYESLALNFCKSWRMGLICENEANHVCARKSANLDESHLFCIPPIPTGDFGFPFIFNVISTIFVNEFQLFFKFRKLNHWSIFGQNTVFEIEIAPNGAERPLTHKGPHFAHFAWPLLTQIRAEEAPRSAPAVGRGGQTHARAPSMGAARMSHNRPTIAV